LDWNFCNSWKSVKGEISRREGRDMKPVRLAVMQKVEFPNPYIKAGGGGGGVCDVRTFVLFSLCASCCCQFLIIGGVK